MLEIFWKPVVVKALTSWKIITIILLLSVLKPMIENIINDNNENVINVINVNIVSLCSNTVLNFLFSKQI